MEPGTARPLLPGTALLLIAFTLIIASTSKSGLLELATVEKRAHKP